ncbi:MAG: hypothetical protein JW818_14060, partial [Pirellulales bacterium]|nr:hypothetical protein [Pirellulales bacterium]
QMVRTPDSTAGQTAQCPACGEAVQIPVPNQPRQVVPVSSGNPVGLTSSEPATAAVVSDLTNPYQAPPDVDYPGGQFHSQDEDSAERIRYEYLNHEASVRSIGWLYYLGAGFLGLSGTSMVVLGPIEMEPGGILVGSFFLALAVAFGLLGHGLRHLKPSTRIAVGILSAIGLLLMLINGSTLLVHHPDVTQAAGRLSSVFLGLLINAYILYLLFSSKGSMVFSSEYQDIIARTPHIRYRVSPIIWILFGLLVTLIVFSIVAFVVLGFMG